MLRIIARKDLLTKGKTSTKSGSGLVRKPKNNFSRRFTQINADLIKENRIRVYLRKSAANTFSSA